MKQAGAGTGGREPERTPPMPGPPPPARTTICSPMLKPFRSFRVKLIVMFVAVFGMVQVVLSLAGVAIRERQLRHFFDDQLHERSVMFEKQLRDSPIAVNSRTLTEAAARMPRSIYFREWLAQVRHVEGDIIARTESLGEYALPWDERTPIRPGMPDVRMVAMERIRPGAEPSAYRMMSRLVPDLHGQPVVIQVATSYEAIERSIASLQWYLYAGMPAGLLAAAITSWVVTGRLSQRINRVAAMAQELTPEDLSRRLAEPQSDDEVADLVRQINRMLDRLEAGFHAQERFIHDASHELKTPIAALITEAQVVRMTGYDPAELRRFIDSANNELLHMSRLIESLLLLASTSREPPRASFESCDINDLLIESVRRCQPLAQEYGIDVRVQALDAERSCAATVHCNAELIIIMISNLLRNAIRFTPRGGSVCVGTDSADRRLTLWVSDRGPGIDEQDLPHVFDRFYQGRQRQSRRGTGLGLAIADAIARLHDGRIAVRNNEIGGATFTVELPVHDEAPDAGT